MRDDEEYPYAAMGDRLRAARLGAGYKSARKAALKFRWIYDTYIQHERGSRSFNWDTATKYEAAYGTPAAELISGKVAPGRQDRLPEFSEQVGRLAIEAEAKIIDLSDQIERAFRVLLEDGLEPRTADDARELGTMLARETRPDREGRPRSSDERLLRALRLLHGYRYGR